MKHNIPVVITILLSMTLIFLSGGLLFAQRETIREVNVTGSYAADENEAPADAYANALFDAKKEALKAAGVYENISSTAIIEIGGSGENFREINSELARIELEGRVLVKKKEQSMQQYNGLYKYIVTILADVKVEESEEDLKFDFMMEGLRNTYLEGENVSFTITPTADCYLRIFYFDPNSNEQLYPIEKVYKDIHFEANVPVSFPLPHDIRYLYDRLSIAQDYTMRLTDKNNDFEQGVLLVIALKDDLPFNKEVTYENVMNWLFRIKRSQKRVYWYGLNIARRY